VLNGPALSAVACLVIPDIAGRITHYAVAPSPSAPQGTAPADAGTGQSDANGFVLASLDNVAAAQNSNYEDTSGNLTLDVYYTDSNGNQVFAFSVTENVGITYIGSGNDPTLEGTKLTSGGNALTNTPVQVDAQPIVSGSYSAVQIGEGSTDGSGHIIANINMTPIQSKPVYVSPNSVVQVSVMVPNGSGGWQQNTTFPEYVGGDNDPVLLTKQVMASNMPVPNAAVANPVTMRLSELQAAPNITKQNRIAPHTPRRPRSGRGCHGRRGGCARMVA
jgi:hypothetical protein